MKLYYIREKTTGKFIPFKTSKAMNSSMDVWTLEGTPKIFHKASHAKGWLSLWVLKVIKGDEETRNTFRNRYEVIELDVELPPVINGVLKEATFIGRCLWGKMHGDLAGRFHEGEQIQTSRVICNLGNGYFRTQNSVYKVEFLPNAEKTIPEELQTIGKVIPIDQKLSKGWVQ